MEGSGRKPASFATQTNALMRKNLVLQKRNYKTNICVIVFPILLIVLLAYLQSFLSGLGKKLDIKCPCDSNGRPTEATFAGICASGVPFLEPSLGCIVPSPQKWPPLLKVPRAEFRAVNVPFMPFKDLPSEGCRKTKFCPVTFLVTGGNRSFTESLSSNMFTSLDISGKKGGLPDISDLVLATTTISKFSTVENVNFMDDAFAGDESGPIYILQPKCLPNATLMIPFKKAKIMMPIVATCAEALTLWRDDIDTIEKEMYQGYPRGNRNNMTNEIAYAFDLLNSSKEKYNVTIRYNATIRDNTEFDKVETTPNALRVPRAINLASNAYLKLLKGKDVKMQFEFLNEMPQLARPFGLSFDIATKMGELFFAYLLQLLFPVMVGYLVHEKQGKTRIMMKMHGLGDGPYWLISYGYFFVLSCLYMLCCWFFGRLVGLSFFTLNSGKLQLVFYFASMNLQIAFAILVSALFSRARTATVTSYVYIFGIGILGFSYFHGLSDTPFMKGNLAILMELIPGLSLYRGVYELSQYAFSGFGAGAYGIQWSDLKDDINGMKTILIIMAIEWFLFLFISIYFDRDVSNPEQGTGKCNPFSFLFHPKRSTKLGQSFSRLNKNTTVDMDRPDVIRERELVEDLLKNPNDTYSVVCDNLVKVHKGQDGNPDKVAVKGLSLALPRGECFGMLGPNGAGKTTLLSMLTGFLKPTSGTAYISGLDIRVDMNKIYSGIGVCPQHDLLWETLTAREHLMFYGRLKNLTGSTLAKAVNDSLESVNLQGVADKQAGQYSGGMKRRLSVAIALIGDSKVVYLDEPSTGLDPASRKALWKAIMQAKHDRAIILTTHSMEEAEFLCDRLGIFVDGSLQCVGNANELKAKFGGLYILTITSSPDQDGEVENLVKKLAPNSKKTYHIAGTQKFEMAKEGVKLSRVFELMEHMKKRVNIIAWGVADTNLEDVFIKVARNADAFSTPK